VKFQPAGSKDISVSCKLSVCKPLKLCQLMPSGGKTPFSEALDIGALRFAAEQRLYHQPDFSIA
jgi:hypothetical protein